MKVRRRVAEHAAVAHSSPDATIAIERAQPVVFRTAVAVPGIHLEDAYSSEAIIGTPTDVLIAPPGLLRGQIPVYEAALEWEPRVLVVDDDAISRLAAAALLRSLGLTVDVAAGGHEALRLNGSWPYVAVFMDCEMPEIDGYTAARKLRGRFAKPHVPVIAVTSRSRSVSLASGMDHHFTKPLEVDLLRADCARLGLLAPETAPTNGAGRQLCIDTPLLDPYVFVQTVADDRRRMAQAAATFVAAATLRLPELWRASNVGNAQALQSVSVALREEAAQVGAERISALCERLAETAARADGTASIERQLRRALAETARAIADYLDAMVLTDEPETEESVQGDAEPVVPADESDQGDAEPVAAIDDAHREGLVRVAFADDDRIARIAMRAMLERAAWIELVGDAGGVEEAVELAAVQQPDVFVLDWNMPGGRGADAVRRISISCPEARIVALSSYDDPDTWSAVTASGAACLVAKGGSGEELTEAIGRVVRELSQSPGGTAEDTPPAPRLPRLRVSGNSSAGQEETFDSGPPLDPARLEQLHAECAGTDLFAELTELFGSETPKRLRDLRTAIEAKDTQAVSRLAHRLKGGCLTLGAYCMGDLCGALEIAVSGGSLEGADALADRIDSAFRAAHASLLRAVR